MQSKSMDWFLYDRHLRHERVKTQPAITCSKLTIETLEQGVKYVQSVSSVSVVNFEQVNAGWKEYPFHVTTHKCGFNMETILF